MSDKPLPGVPQPKKPDAEDQSATVPAAGWDGAKTVNLPGQPPAKPDLAATLAVADFGAKPADAATIAQDFSSGQAATLAATLATAPTAPLAPITGQEATVITAVPRREQLAATQPTVTGREVTMVGSSGGATGPQALTNISNSGQTGSFAPQTQSLTRTGRTRINLNLPADARQLDEKLQLSRSSVLSDMATARFGRGDSLPPGIQKLIAEQGTEGRYAITKPLAAGGMGAVLAIEDHDFRRGAAMKVIHGKFSQNPEAVERFLAEAQVTAQLEHPNIVPIHDLGVMDDGTLYFTMKLIEGQSVGGVVKSLKAGEPAAVARWTEAEKILTFLKILDGVGFAHSRGVVHRDIKPDNIMLGAHGEVLVVDWGIAKVLANADARSELVKQVASVREKQSLSQTMEGSAMGTIFYMPPEQAEGKLDQIDGRSDIYALGATLYELLSTKRCLDSGGLSDMIVKIVNGNFIPLTTALPGVNLDLVAIVHRAMSLTRERRYATCADFAADLRMYLSGQAVLARKRNLLERIGLWYAQHRREVQVGAAMVILVAATAVTVQAMAQHKKNAAIAENVAAAHALADHAAGPDLVASLQKATALIHAAYQLDDHRPDVAEYMQALDGRFTKANEAHEAELERQAGIVKAADLLADSIKLKAEDKLEKAREELLSALVLAPNNKAISEALVGVDNGLANERQRRLEAEASGLKARGDQFYAQASKLALVDAQVEPLITQATDAYKQSLATGVSIPGIDVQVQGCAILRTKSKEAVLRQDEQNKGKAAATQASAALASRKIEDAKGFISQALGYMPGEITYQLLKEQILAADRDDQKAKKLADDQAKCAQATKQASASLAAGKLDDAQVAIHQALGFTPNDPTADAVRQQIIEAERVAAEARHAAKRKSDCIEFTAKARQALAAGNLAQAADFVANAVTALPGDADAQKAHDEIRDAQARAAHAAALAEARAKAGKEMAAAHAHVATLQTEEARLKAASATLERLKVELAGQLPEQQKPLWQAHRDVRAAEVACSEAWSLAETASQNALAMLGEQMTDPIATDAKAVLSQLYQQRLLEARARHDLASTLAFTNLVQRYDDGRFSSLFTNQGSMAITGAAGTTVTLRTLDQGADLRLVPTGQPITLTLPMPLRMLPAGRYQLSAGDVLMSIVLTSGHPLTIAWPGALPSIPGIAMRYVPAGPSTKPFMLAQCELTHDLYDQFIHDPAQWPKVQAAWKACALDGSEQTPMSFVPRRAPNGGENWQAMATGDKASQLTSLDMPKAYAGLPLTGISRDDAEAYCAWLSKKTGLTVRLPTAAEWQYAANGGDDRRIFPWGDEFDVSLAVTAYTPGKKGVVRDGAMPCGSIPTDIGPFGHADLAGNVREWLGDQGDAAGIQKALIAGGSWGDDRPEQFRTTATESVPPFYVGANIGFRILVDVP